MFIDRPHPGAQESRTWGLVGSDASALKVSARKHLALVVGALHPEVAGDLFSA